MSFDSLLAEVDPGFWRQYLVFQNFVYTTFTTSQKSPRTG